MLTGAGAPRAAGSRARPADRGRPAALLHLTVSNTSGRLAVSSTRGCPPLSPIQEWWTDRRRRQRWRRGLSDVARAAAAAVVPPAAAALALPADSSSTRRPTPAGLPNPASSEVCSHMCSSVPPAVVAAKVVRVGGWQAKGERERQRIRSSRAEYNPPGQSTSTARGRIGD